MSSVEPLPPEPPTPKKVPPPPAPPPPPAAKPTHMIKETTSSPLSERNLTTTAEIERLAGRARKPDPWLDPDNHAPDQGQRIGFNTAGEPMAGRIMTMDEVKQEFKVTEVQIAEWVADHRMSRFRLGDKILYRHDEVEALTVKPKPAPPPPPPPHVVEFKKVTKTYAGKKPYTAIKDVTFCVDDLPDLGEFIAILGPSGCGKSTVLKLIAGLEPQFPATSGEVLVFGKPVVGPDADRGMVFQEYSAFDNRTVLDNVSFGLECRGIPFKKRREQALFWMDKVGLNPVKDACKYPHQLSGGMRQRVAIARSLVLKPRILLMDEPFGALDPMTSMRMQDLLIQLWKDSETTVFFVTHSITEAVFLGDRIYLFSNAPGTIVEQVYAPRPTKQAVEAYEAPEFQEKVRLIRKKIAKMEEEKGVI